MIPLELIATTIIVFTDLLESLKIEYRRIEYLKTSGLSCGYMDLFDIQYSISLTSDPAVLRLRSAKDAELRSGCIHYEKGDHVFEIWLKYKRHPPSRFGKGAQGVRFDTRSNFICSSKPSLHPRPQLLLLPFNLHFPFCIFHLAISPPLRCHPAQALIVDLILFPFHFIRVH